MAKNLTFSMKHTPKITVLMPVYNGEKYISEAIDSILNQTFSDFEFLIIDDGSTDNSCEIIKSYKDKRIYLVKNETNLQIVKTLNKGINLANGEYIIRMDADDISLPYRFEKQIQFMESHTDIDICGSWVETFYDKQSIWETPEKDEDIKAYLFFNSAIIHPSVIIRKKSIIKHALYYRDEYNKSEDYDLWERSSKYLKYANIPEVLLKYRVEIKKNQNEYKKVQKRNTIQIRNRQLLELIPVIEDFDFQIHDKLTSIERNYPKNDIIDLNKWIQRLVTANKNKKKYDNIAFIKLLTHRFFTICNLSTHLGLWSFYRYHSFIYRKYVDISFWIRLKFFIKCLVKKQY